MTVAYEPATGCTGGPTPGALALADHYRRTTGRGHIGIYVCRPIRGRTSGYSVHSEGRAVDLAANAGDARQKQSADAYCDWLISNSDTLQVQYLIWNRRSWKAGRGWAPYTGTSPHTDHIHVELTRAGGSVAHPLTRGGLTTAEAPLMALSDNEQAELLQSVRDIRNGVVRGPVGQVADNVFDKVVARTGDLQNNLNILLAAVGSQVGSGDAAQVAAVLLDKLPKAVVDELKARL